MRPRAPCLASEAACNRRTRVGNPRARPPVHVAMNVIHQARAQGLGLGGPAAGVFVWALAYGQASSYGITKAAADAMVRDKVDLAVSGNLVLRAAIF